MIAQEDEKSHNQYVLQDNQQDQQQQTNYNHISKDLYLNKVFCWIEAGDAKNVIKFYNTFPHLINQLYTPNHWNPLMYAVRYGNMQLMQFLVQKGMRTTIQGIYNHVSIVHAAVYSGELPILHYVLTEMKANPNPFNCQTAPLKIAMKTGNSKMVQLLICKGAFYSFGDVLNNLQLKQAPAQDNNKYLAIGNTQNGNKQIGNNLVVQDTTIKDCPIKQTLRWARLKQVMYMKHYSQILGEDQFINAKQNINVNLVEVKAEEPQSNQQNIQIQKVQKEGCQNSEAMEEEVNQVHKFTWMAQILKDQDYFLNIIKICVGKGDSILLKNDPQTDEKIQKQKDSIKQSTKSKQLK